MRSARTTSRRYQAWIERRATFIVVAVLLAGVLAGVLASRLKLKTAIVELLPSDDPGVVTLHQMQERMGDMSLLLLGIHSPDAAANERYAEALTKKIEALPKSVVQLVTYHVRDLSGFFKENRWLYVPEDDLESIRDRLRKEISRRKNPLFIDIGDDEPLAEMEKRIAGRKGADSRFPGGLFATADKQYLWVAALPPGGLFVERAGEELMKAVKHIVAENPPERYHPEMRVQIGGQVANSIAERRAIENDIVWVTAVCVVIVAFSIGFYFRRPRAVPLVGVPALVGTTMAFATAQLAFGFLNASTAFLGPIIIGNGINYAIVLMARYEEERSRGSNPSSAMQDAIAGTWRATAVAAFCASAAYASLMVTSFRGFYQFGVMGAVGAVSCWLATYTVLPAMLVLLDRARPGTRVGRPPLRLDSLGSLIDRRFRVVSALVLLVSVASVVGLRHFLHDPFEYDFRKLGAGASSTEEAQRFNKRMDELFGRWPSPTIILGDDASQVEQIRAAIWRQDEEKAKLGRRGKSVIGQVATVWDLLPGTPEVQRRKLSLIADIRKLTNDPALEILDKKERDQLAKIDPPAGLKELGPLDLPPLARRPFTEVDGSVGRVVLVYPVMKGLSVWNGRDLLDIASVLQKLPLPGGKLMETSGQAVVFGAMIRSILHDGPVATVAALIVVLVIISLVMRPAAAALMALSTLLLGAMWMVGAAGWVGVRVTFLNFIALPITFGIGAEYALNVVARYRQTGDIMKAVNSTGAAVALCSWTTIVGYGSLLAARNQALQGFGRMAILGEVACLIAAVIALPAGLRWWQARREGRREPGSEQARTELSAQPSDQPE